MHEDPTELSAARTGQLTERQRQVLAFIRLYFERNDHLPTSRRIAREFGVFQTASNGILQRLAKAGYLEKNEDGGYRFVKEGRP
jgi:Mn-dependent DtxR family transcriptional regulator